MTVEQLAASQVITLQPWGRVEGVLRIGTKPVAGQTVNLRSMLYGRTAVPPGFLALLQLKPTPTGSSSSPMFRLASTSSYKYSPLRLLANL